VHQIFNDLFDVLYAVVCRIWSNGGFQMLVVEKQTAKGDRFGAGAEQFFQSGFDHGTLQIRPSLEGDLKAATSSPKNASSASPIIVESSGRKGKKRATSPIAAVIREKPKLPTKESRWRERGSARYSCQCVKPSGVSPEALRAG